MSQDMTPIFIFSLPRSGSTITQRVIAAHPEVATTSEPWLLLPFLYTLKSTGAYAEYGHRASASAIQDFCAGLPHGADDYLAEIRSFVTRLYRLSAQDNQRFFLDKTPRYHLVAEEIVRAFPDARFVYLWRNPLAVAASIIDTFGRGNWQLYDYKVDLFDGLANLIETFQAHPENAHAVQFERLVGNPEEEWQALFRYLGLSWQPDILQSFSKVELEGRMGDKKGTSRYQELSSEPLSKFRNTLANPLRKAWCRRYLNWIGEERLAIMGYSRRELLDELDTIPMGLHKLGSDLLRISYGLANCAFETRIMAGKLRRLPGWHKIHAHS